MGAFTPAQSVQGPRCIAYLLSLLLTAAFGWWGSRRGLGSSSSHRIPFSFSESWARGQGLGCFEGRDLGQVIHIIKVRNGEKQRTPVPVVYPQLFFPTTCPANLQQLQVGHQDAEPVTSRHLLQLSFVVLGTLILQQRIITFTVI